MPEKSIADLYTQFSAPICDLNCGEYCAAYNEKGVPFCCDTEHAVPTAFPDEWDYLLQHTDLWHLYTSPTARLNIELHSLAPAGQFLLECLGHRACQRDYRTFDCRSFPFFPYITRQGEFLGLTYHWEYQDRCWIISHLNVITPLYREQFINTFENLFQRYPEEIENYRYYSSLLRRSFGQRHRAITLLHRNGYFYKVSPRNGRLRRVTADRMPKFGPYKIAAELPFPGEIF